MIKVCIFNKSNVSRFDDCKKFFKCINSKISLTCCIKTGAVYQNVLDSGGRAVAPVCRWYFHGPRQQRRLRH